ncbi:MAG: SRPBCC domain-containing protein [Chloroflexota bacterium]
MMSKSTIEKNYQVPFSRERLFEAWISPDTVIAPVSKVEVDPKINGYLRLMVEMPDGAAIMEGKFLTVSYPTQLVYSWEWDGDGEVTEVTVTFKANTMGTEIVVLHSGFQSEESRGRHDVGWDSYVDGVVQRLQSMS